MDNKEKKVLANYVLRQLKKTFPNAQIELEYKKNDPWQLLAVVMLSAQTTDKKVNQISVALFDRFKSVRDFANARSAEVEPYIKSIGLYRNKARNLVLAAKKIVAEFKGKVPKERSLLETLPGVGRKTSAVVVANAFNTPALAVDTHVSRVAKRLGLTALKDPNKIEEELTELFKKDLILAHHALILHGRYICIAKKPRCSICPLSKKCPKIGVKVWQ
jgi:endonuclease III